MKPSETIQKHFLEFGKLLAQIKMKVGRNVIKQGDKTEWEKIFDAIDDWICVIDLDATILRSNQSVETFFQFKKKEAVGLKCCRIIHGIDGPADDCPFTRMLKTKARESAEEKNKNDQWLGITIDPIFNGDGDLVGAVHMSRNIKPSMWTPKNENSTHDLNKTGNQIKILSGLLPICSNCKRIRDTDGSWDFIESYIQENSEATFSHGMCPDCSEKFYGKDDWYIEMKKKKSKKNK